MPEKITSASNPRIRRLVELQKKPKARREEGLFVIEGTRLCMDTPARFLREAYVTERWLHGAAEAERARIEGGGGLRIFLVSDEAMAKAADTATPQGILCTARIPSFQREELLGEDCHREAPPGGCGAFSENAGKSHLPGKDCRKDYHKKAPLVLILEDIRDPGNLGTIFRTAEAAGATGIFMSRGTADLFSPKAVRATMSAIFRMPFLVSGDLVGEIAALRAHGIRSYAAHLGGTRPYDALPLAEGTAFLIGNEANGLSGGLAAAADEKTIIPMSGGAESLNAAMAAGILLFEAARQRRTARAGQEPKGRM